jgi:thiol:disulfide interchange protein
MRLMYSLLSAFIPGTGQIAAGYRRRGLLMLGMTIVLVMIGFAVYRQGMSTIFSWLVQPRILVGLFLLNIAVFLFRIGAVIDAYVAPRSEEEVQSGGWRGALAVTGLVMVLALTAAPHAVFGYYTYLTHDTLTTVFSTGSLADIELDPTATPDPSPAPTATPEPTVTPEPISTSEQTISNHPFQFPRKW